MLISNNSRRFLIISSTLDEIAKNITHRLRIKKYFKKDFTNIPPCQALFSK